MKKPGIGLMIAVGRPSGPPPRYKSTPEIPKEPAPSERGGGPKDPDAGRPEQSVTVSPEAVCYHDGSQQCRSCEYYDNGHCRVLQMPVDDQGWCKAWESKLEPAEAGEPMNEGMMEGAH